MFLYVFFNNLCNINNFFITTTFEIVCEKLIILIIKHIFSPRWLCEWKDCAGLPQPRRGFHPGNAAALHAEGVDTPPSLSIPDCQLTECTTLLANYSFINNHNATKQHVKRKVPNLLPFLKIPYSVTHFVLKKDVLI